MKHQVKKERTVQPRIIDRLVNRAFFSKGRVKDAAKKSIRSYATEQGIVCSSLYSLYRSRSRGAVRGFTVPAMNIRGLSYDFIRAILRAAMKSGTGAFIIEIARSELLYSEQTPDDVVVAALAAALREGYRTPLFIQGDHYKIIPSNGIEREVKTIKSLIDASIAAGMYHIDIDASKTVDLSRRTADEQQEQNGRLTAELTSYIRAAKHDAVIGGEIGEIGGRVSTAADLRAFMSMTQAHLRSGEGINKVAVQTGTSHGGIPNPDGSVQRVSVDLGTLRELSLIAQNEFSIAGAVQHGASTLTEEQIASFPAAGAIEVHLSTEFQNIIFDHPSFPGDLRTEIEAYLLERFKRERIPGQTDRQFVYKQRKHAWGPFKKAIATLPEPVRRSIADALERKVSSLFAALNVTNTQATLKQYLH